MGALHETPKKLQVNDLQRFAKVPVGPWEGPLNSGGIVAGPASTSQLRAHRAPPADSPREAIGAPVADSAIELYNPRSFIGLRCESTCWDGSTGATHDLGVTTLMASPTDRLLILVGTHNAHKVEEIAAVLEDTEVAGRRIYVVGADGRTPVIEVEETGDTFEANATLKAMAFNEAARQLPPGRRPDLTIADDSGLCVAALDGAPGVRSARYAGEHASDEDNNERLLVELADVPDGERTAEFVCVIVCTRVPSDEENAHHDLSVRPLFHVEGRCSGEILRSRRGTGGFGYDPLFYYPPLEKSFAEIGDEKNSVSHRGRALHAFRRTLEEELMRNA